MTCVSCGAPGASAERCPRCLDDAGAPLAFEPVLARTTDEMVLTQGLAPAVARQTAAAYLAQLPAWQAEIDTSCARRLTMHVELGDVTLRGVAGLARPLLEDGAEHYVLVEAPGGWVVRGRGEAETAGDCGAGDEGDLVVAIPIDCPDVVVTLGSGDLNVRDLAGHLQARLQSGDAHLSDVASVDLWLQFGDAYLAGAFDAGRGRVEVLTGDVYVTPRRDADVRLTLDLTAGDGYFEGLDFTLDSSHGGCKRYEVVLGAGCGELDLIVTSGDVYAKMG